MSDKSVNSPDLEQWAETFKPMGMPPIDKWNPPLTGDLDMRIAADGQWFYQGGLIKRERLVRLFSRILKREGDDYFMVTPVEKYRIRVDDVPFVVTDVRSVAEAGLTYQWADTQLGDSVRLDDEHTLDLRAPPGETQAIPYVQIRGGLEARFHRNVFYRLIESAQQEIEGDDVCFYLISGTKRVLIGRFAADEAGLTSE